MIKRFLGEKLKSAAVKYPVITVTGPRQSGKTTLVRSEFSKFEYVSLELPDIRTLALEDPRGFFSRYKDRVIIDEAQRAPEIFSYIQSIVDESDKPGQFILTGSQNFLLTQGISQSLAGRCAVFHLLPFSLSELKSRKPCSPEHLGTKLLYGKEKNDELEQVLFTGFYPRIHDKNLSPRDWLSGYYQTYIERDVRNLANVGYIEAFSRFTRLCAGRNGQLLNLSNLGSDCGVTHSTARRWISILEASFIVTLLRPYHKNFGKRMIKSPKLYFLDTGLLCYLLNIQDSKDIYNYSQRGSIFESFVISELYKNYFHRGDRPSLYFWRDSAGHEIDVIIDTGREPIAVDIKSSRTISNDFFDNLKYWKDLLKKQSPYALIYGGDEAYERTGVVIYPWNVI